MDRDKPGCEGKHGTIRSAMVVMSLPQGVIEQPNPDRHNEDCAGDFKRRCSSDTADSTLNKDKSGENQNNRQPDMSENEDNTGCEACEDGSGAAEKVRHQNCLAVARHNGVHQAK